MIIMHRCLLWLPCIAVIVRHLLVTVQVSVCVCVCVCTCVCVCVCVLCVCACMRVCMWREEREHVCLYMRVWMYTEYVCIYLYLICCAFIHAWIMRSLCWFYWCTWIIWYESDLNKHSHTVHTVVEQALSTLYHTICPISSNVMIEIDPPIFSLSKPNKFVGTSFGV